MKDFYTLGEVSRILGRKPHQIVYPIVTQKIAEPELRVAGKRLFRTQDVENLGQYLRVRPNWDALEPKAADVEPTAHLTLKPPFEVVTVGEACYEIRDADGEVFAWTTDRAHALVVCGLLESATPG